MKTKLNMMLLAFAAVSVNLYAVPQAPPAPLPQFMDKEQLTQWNATKAATAKVASSSQDTSTQFYTGKPYVADAGGYVFKYRTYNPEMSRWTSADPSGFPDGSNNFIYAKNECVAGFDKNGLAYVETYEFDAQTTTDSIDLTEAGAAVISTILTTIEEAPTEGGATVEYGGDALDLYNSYSSVTGPVVVIRDYGNVPDPGTPAGANVFTLPTTWNYSLSLTTLTWTITTGTEIQFLYE